MFEHSKILEYIETLPNQFPRKCRYLRLWFIQSRTKVTNIGQLKGKNYNTEHIYWKFCKTVTKAPIDKDMNLCKYKFYIKHPVALHRPIKPINTVTRTYCMYFQHLVNKRLYVQNDQSRLQAFDLRRRWTMITTVRSHLSWWWKTWRWSRSVPTCCLCNNTCWKHIQ
jgi:hypothetical protein